MASANKKLPTPKPAAKAAPAAPQQKATVKVFKKRAPLIRRTDAEWLAIFQEQSVSGMNLEDYCKPKGMSPSSFSVKRKLLCNKYNIDDIETADLSAIKVKSVSSKSKPAAKPAAAKPVAANPAAAVAKPAASAAKTAPAALKVVQPSSKTQAAPKMDEDTIKLVLDNETTVIIPRAGSAEWIASYMAEKASRK